MDARVVYLIAFPYRASADQATQTMTLTKFAPHFQALDTEIAELGQSEITAPEGAVSLRRQVIDGQVQSVECRYTLTDVLNPASNQRRQRMQTALRDFALRESGYGGPFVEEYTILCLTEPASLPDEFVEAHRLELAPLLRSESRSLTEAEAAHILASRARYADSDLTIVDWEGALIFDPDSDFQSEIELLKLGNYQILRYRLLDRAVERNLEAVRRELESRRRFTPWNTVVRDALEKRLELLLDFEKSEQTLLLIGDWYTAQLYRLIVDEFYIDEWKAAVHVKLDQLESITDTVRENFSFSWDRLFDVIQLVGWLLLLIGYFVLFYLDTIALGN
jgi:hypothetical protein